MAFTPEQRAKAQATRAANKLARETAQAKREAKKAEQPVIAGKPKNLFSGMMRKFDIMGRNGSTTDPIPGFRLYAFKDVEEGMRISAALQSGWQFVTKEEVVLNDAWTTPLDTDLGSKVRIYGGIGADGKPFYHFLMKKPLALDAEHQAEREVLHQQIDAALREGSFNMTAGEKRYTAAHPPMGSPSGLPPISISSKLSR